MPRAKGPDREQLHVRILPATRDVIDSVSAALGITAAQVVDLWARDASRRQTKRNAAHPEG